MRIRSSIAALAVVAGGLAPLAQAAPAHGDVSAAVAQCTDVAGPATKDTQQVAIALHAVHPAAAIVVAGCGIVQGGATVAYAHAFGMVAFDAVTARVNGGGYSVCSDLHVVFVDGSEVSDMNCP